MSNFNKFFDAEAWAKTSRDIYDFCTNLDAVEGTLTKYNQEHDKAVIFDVMANEHYFTEKAVREFDEYAERIGMPKILRDEERSRFADSVSVDMLNELTPLRQEYFKLQRELRLTPDDVQRNKSGYAVTAKKGGELRENLTHTFTKDEQKILDRLKDVIEWMREESPKGWNFINVITWALNGAWSGAVMADLEELPKVLIKSKRIDFATFRAREEDERAKRRALNAELNAKPEPVVVDRENSIPVVYGSHLYGEHANDE